jgi:hypothetical protein
MERSLKASSTLLLVTLIQTLPNGLFPEKPVHRLICFTLHVCQLCAGRSRLPLAGDHQSATIQIQDRTINLTNVMSNS